MEYSNDNQISFSWDLHYACNYRCPYCWWDGKWQELAKLNRYLSVEQWMKYWGNIYSRYGNVGIEILGGEPFIYPNFTELIKELSDMHNIRVTTNLSTDIEDFIRQIGPSKVNVSPTFHPLFAQFDSFVKKAMLLKENGFTENINYLAYPPQLKQIPYYKERFNQKGLSLSVMTFWGEYKRVSYPDGYTKEEREIIGVHLGKRADREFQLVPKKMPKGKLCRAGQRYAVIQANGNVIRCGGSGLNEMIGNFFAENFKLLDSPLPCKAEYCKCNEWAFLLVEEEVPTEKKEITAVSLPDNFLAVKKDSRNSIQTLSPKFPRLDPPYRIHWNWEVTYECNYRCTYCNVWKEHKERYPSVDINKWKKVWDSIFEKYACCHIRFSGGEPFVYPNFIDLVAILLEKHTVDITTNLTFDIETFLNKIKPGGISISASFHPEFVDIDKFIEKVLLLHNNGFPTGVAYVAYPDYLWDLNRYKSATEDKAILFKIIPFNGEFKGQKYPQNYTDEEREILKRAAINTNNSFQRDLNMQWYKQNIQKKNINTKGKLCRMGQMYAKIFPDGHVTRCCVFDSKCLGNIFDDNFRLLDSPEPCDSKGDCPCYKAMIVSEEYKWLSLWGAPEHPTYKIERVRKIMNNFAPQTSSYITEVKETTQISREGSKDALT